MGLPNLIEIASSGISIIRPFAKRAILSPSGEEWLFFDV
jgi:hypothetical protein